jgi:hypothetical protein
LEEQVYGFDDQLEWLGDEISAQLEVLIEQFYIKGGANSYRHQPHLHFLEEDDKCIVEEVVIQFGTLKEIPCN